MEIIQTRTRAPSLTAVKRAPRQRRCPPRTLPRRTRRRRRVSGRPRSSRRRRRRRRTSPARRNPPRDKSTREHCHLAFKNTCNFNYIRFKIRCIVRFTVSVGLEQGRTRKLINEIN